MTPLEFDGPAQLTHINARKEGPDGEKILVADLKFALTTGNDILIAFHPQLRLLLFTKEGAPRFELMGPVEWNYEFDDMVLELHSGPLCSVRFEGVRMKKWHFAPKLGHEVAVAFQAQVRPDDGQFEHLGQLLLYDTVRIKVYGATGDLFGANAASPDSGTGAEPAQPMSASSPAAPAEDRDPARTAAPALTEDLLEAMRAAGRAEAKKLEDERDFDLGFVAACRAAKLSKAFVDEHFSALESAYTDGFEEEAEREP